MGDALSASPAAAMRGVAPSPRDAARLAALGVGAMSLVGAVLFIVQPATGAVATVVAAAALAWGSGALGPWSRWRAWPHVLAAALALITAVGLCASRCGSFAAYESVLGVPTAVAGLIAHGAVAIAALVARRLGRGEQAVDLAIAALAGASLFYAAVLIAAGSWCGGCAAIHAVMAVQAARLVAHAEARARTALVATLIAAAGVVNALYHHRAQPVRDDPAALLAYLRGLWASELPPQQVEQFSEAAGAAAAAAPPISAPSASVVPVVAPATPAPSEVAPARAIADANRWGRRDAPVTMIIAIDPGCPACANQFAQIAELGDLVDAGRLQVRFLLSYRNDAAQATASIAYAAGFVGERALIETLGAFFAEQKRIVTPADAVSALPPSFPRAQALAAVRRHQRDITALLADAARLKERLGAASEPTTWLMPTGASEPARTFRGTTLTTVMRLAAISLMPSQRDDEAAADAVPGFTGPEIR
ncbi:MAG TPA: thioredoxin domain-containing protein [Planctomycetota bacterium]|nr:thioredoxin domain-containing protein [Planctomycetota bacterium]